MAEGRACGGKTQSIHSDIWNGSAVLGGARPIASGDGEGVRGRAGLLCDVTALISDERASFLRRARQRHIGRIDETEVRLALRRTIESAGKTIEDAALGSATRATDGFAYMLQLVGYFAWEEAWGRETLDSASVARGIEEAREDFSRGVLDATYREMSRKDREFALAMLKDEHGSRLTDIAGRMGVSNGYASTYKRRLLGQGVIGERPGGLLDFDIPLMRAYLSEFAQD